LGYCLKAEGDWCHVINSKATCVAANSSDTVPMFIALNATLELMTGQGPQQLPLVELYKQNGMANHTIDKDALVTGIKIPPFLAGHRSVYRKVRSRGAIDFPQLGLALVAQFNNGTCDHLTAVVNAVMPKPKVLKKLELAHGTELEEDVIDALADLAFVQTRPQASVHGEPTWRRHMARVEMKRGLCALRDDIKTRAIE
jgi:CO/xanthine dehydrogenase FAD-binding subunit